MEKVTNNFKGHSFSSQNFDDTKMEIFKNIDKISFFKTLQEEGYKKEILDIIKYLEIKEYQKNDLIFKQFSISDKFYIILTGKVNIFSKIKKKHHNFEPNLENIIKREEISWDPKNEFFEKYKENEFFYCQSNGCFLHYLTNKIYPGESFGELGLIYMKERTRTLIAGSRVILAELSAENFKKIIQIPIFNRINIKNKLFQCLLSDYCDENEIFEICTFFNFSKKISGKYLFTENSVFDKIFFIIEGEIVLQKKVNLNNIKEDYQFTDETNLFDDKKKNLIKSNFELIIYGKNEFVGIKELLEKKEVYYFSGRVKKDLTYYMIDVKNIIKCFEYFPNFHKYFLIKNKSSLMNLNSLLYKRKKSIPSKKIENKKNLHNCKFLKPNSDAICDKIFPFIQTNKFNNNFSQEKNSFFNSKLTNKQEEYNYKDFQIFEEKKYWILNKKERIPEKKRILNKITKKFVNIPNTTKSFTINFIKKLNQKFNETIRYKENIIKSKHKNNIDFKIGQTLVKKGFFITKNNSEYFKEKEQKLNLNLHKTPKAAFNKHKPFIKNLIKKNSQRFKHFRNNTQTNSSKSNLFKNRKTIHYFDGKNLLNTKINKNSFGNLKKTQNYEKNNFVEIN